jgi:hypothetical protein
MNGTYATQKLSDKVAQVAMGEWLDSVAPLAVCLAEWALETKAEQEAENGWLRAAESFGWEEALVESYYESGLIARPW